MSFLAKCKRLIYPQMVFMLLICTFPDVSEARDTPDILWKRSINSDRINATIFSWNGDYLISGGSDRLINFWRVSDGKMTRALNSNAPSIHESAIESLSITRDGNKLASSSYKVVKLWTLNPTVSVKTLSLHTDWVVGVAFSPDGALLASASFDGTVRIWKSSDGTALKVLKGQGGLARTVSFSPDGNYLASSGGGDNKILIWKTSDWSLTKALTGHQADVYSISFSPDSQMIASGGYDRTARLWSLSAGTELARFSGNGNVYGVGFSPDNQYMAFTDGEGGTIRLVRVADNQVIRTFTDETENVQCLAFSNQGLLAFGRVDKTVVLSRVLDPIPPPEIVPALLIASRAADSISLRLEGVTDQTCVLDESFDLIFWIPVRTNKFSNSSLNFDLLRGTEHKFYRGRVY